MNDDLIPPVYDDDLEPGQITDPVRYAEAVASGRITEIDEIPHMQPSGWYRMGNTIAVVVVVVVVASAASLAGLGLYAIVTGAL